MKALFSPTTSSALAELILVCGPAGGITNGWRVRLMILEECHTSSGRKTKTTEREKKKKTRRNGPSSHNSRANERNSRG